MIMNYIDEKIANKETEEPAEDTVETANIGVTVSDEDENPISNAVVTIYNNGNLQFTGTTGSRGGCTIREVPFGNYSVGTDANGYVSGIDSITVNGDMNITIVLIKDNENEDGD
jgi:hypothetical protein